MLLVRFLERDVIGEIFGKKCDWQDCWKEILLVRLLERVSVRFLERDAIGEIVLESNAGASLCLFPGSIGKIVGKRYAIGKFIGKICYW